LSVRYNLEVERALPACLEVYAVERGSTGRAGVVLRVRYITSSTGDAIQGALCLDRRRARNKGQAEQGS
jgi:hypothetical protein